MSNKNEELKNKKAELKEDFSCQEMMGQLLGQEMDGCDCGDMMSIMESCCGFKREEGILE
jgi:hypothetical protein